MTLSPGSRAHPGGRTFLFLQGPASDLFRGISYELERLGHRVVRINICVGDWIFWRRSGARNFRGRIAEWPAYVAGILDRESVAEIVLLGEERPYHRLAVEEARKRGIGVVSVDLGYFRPDWIVVERGGMGSNSHFPADPRVILERGIALPKPDFARLYSQSFVVDAACDLLYNLPNVFLWFLYPHYDWHGIYHPLAEYGGWIRRLLTQRKRNRSAGELLEVIVGRKTEVFAFPLQLETDFQIRAHSPFRSQTEALEKVVLSFASSAPKTASLVFRTHPYDNGLIDWGATIQELARRNQVPHRVFVMDGGRLDSLLAISRAMITINSTAALEMLRLGKPLKVLGTAIFGINGIVDTSPLDDFWRSPTPPDHDLLDAFIRLLAASVHVRGNYYSTSGLKAASRAIATRLDQNLVNEPGGFVVKPPRVRPIKISTENREAM